MKKRKRKKTIIDYLLTFVMVVAFGVFVYASYNLLVIQSEYKAGEKTYEQLLEYVEETDGGADLDAGTMDVSDALDSE